LGHQSQALEKKDGALSGAAPDELASVALASLNVNIAAAVLQAAILEHAVDKNAFVQNNILVLKGLAFVSGHELFVPPDALWRQRDRQGSVCGAGFSASFWGAEQARCLRHKLESGGRGRRAHVRATVRAESRVVARTIDCTRLRRRLTVAEWICETRDSSIPILSAICFMVRLCS
jgi:hypothetical protein